MKKLWIGLCITALLTTPFAGFAGEETAPTPDTLTAYFNERGIETEALSAFETQALESLKWQAESYGFTDVQVAQYLEGLKAPDEAVTETQATGDFDLGEVGLSPAAIGTRSYTGGYGSKVEANDQTGTYWLVKSEAGYDEATAFATLPTIRNMASSDRAYMFFAVNTNPSSIVGDYGVVYKPGDGWRPFTNTGVWNPSKGDKGGYDVSWDNGDLLGSTINRVYLHVEITNTSSVDKVTLRVLNADNFSDVLWTKNVSFSGNPINSRLSNVNIYREITMAQNNSGTLNSNTGSWFENAIFANAHLYNSGGYYKWGTSQTDDAFIKAPTASKLGTVQVNSYDKWHGESVSMRYTVPN